ncbi:hypothetical protein ACB098_03G153100 [Castanea mollissima]
MLGLIKMDRFLGPQNESWLQHTELIEVRPVQCLNSREKQQGPQRNEPWLQGKGRKGARTGCFFGISLSSSFPFSFPSSLLLFLQECSVNFFLDESEIKEKMNTSSTTQ